MQCLWHYMENRSFRSRSAWKGAAAKVKETFKDLRYVGGSLLFKPGQGLLPYKNPSERRDGFALYQKFAESLEQTRAMSSRLSELRGSVSVSTLLQTLQDHPDLPSTPTYQTMRYLRSMATVLGLKWEDSPHCWSQWQRMSSHVKERIKVMGLTSYAHALAFRDALRAFHPEYSFADLVCFICLVKLEE
eukprot:s2937_g2.t1